MRRAMISLVAAGALAALSGVAHAAPSDFTSGSATYCLNETCDETANWTAHGSPDDARGHVRFNAPELFMVTRASVDCLAVRDNRAVVSGVLERPHPGLEGPFYALILEDNGPPRANDPNPDRMVIGTSRNPVDCEEGFEFNFPPPFEVARGNVVVMDRTP